MSLEESTRDRSVWLNEDNAHFYDQHPSSDMTREGLEALVDRFCEGPRLEGLLFCVNVQRALFDSRVWEPLWAGYDPDGPGDQPLLASQPPNKRSMELDQRGRNWIHNLWLLHDRGLDHPGIWLERTRHHGRAAWLSVRMNDCHDNQDEQSFWHSSFWQEHPEFRRAPHRDEGWFEGAFDFAHPEVVEHHMALIEEVCQRYDFDGIELDWNRWVRHFRPGHEQAGAAVLTDIMRRTRALVDDAGQRQGRKLELGVRLPSNPQACLDLGYDLITWSREGLVDQVALAPFMEQATYEWPITLWRSLLGERVRLLCQVDAVTKPYPDSGPGGKVLDYAFSMGEAASAFERGTDGIYLFNECYRETPGDHLDRRFPGILDRLLDEAGDPAKLRDTHRRQLPSYQQVTAEGAASGAVLPIPLTRPKHHWSFGRFGKFLSLRIPMGGVPREAGVLLVLGFDAPVGKPDATDLTVRLNSHEPLGKPVPPPADTPLPGNIAHRLAWRVPLDQLHGDVNVIEIAPREQPPGSVVWAELLVDEPRKDRSG